MWKVIFYRFENEFLNPGPYYIQWVIFCWHKPIYVGLPLAFLTPIFLIGDAVIGLVWLVTRWGKNFN